MRNPKIVDRVEKTLLQNSLPWSECAKRGGPNILKCPFAKAWATTNESLDGMVINWTNPEKASTTVRIYLLPNLLFGNGPTKST